MRETPPRARVAGNATPPAAWLQPSPQADDAASRRLALSEGAHQVVSSRPPRWHVGAVPRESEDGAGDRAACRSEEHTSELQSLMRISNAVFCLKKKNIKNTINTK